MRTLLCLLILATVAACARNDAYDATPLPGAAPTPSVENRFPQERGGLGYSAADEVKGEKKPWRLHDL